MTLPLKDLSDESLELADSLLDQASHDVGKYMSMTARNVDGADMDDEIELALRADLLHTDGTDAAWVLWRPLFEELAALCADPQLRKADELMANLARACCEDGWDVAHICRLAVEAADLMTSLRRQARSHLLARRGKMP